jgi:hypothetical protein
LEHSSNLNDGSRPHEPSNTSMLNNFRPTFGEISVGTAIILQYPGH